MRARIIVLCSTLFLFNISAAQTSHKHTRSSTDSAHLPSAAFAAMQKIDPERIRAHVRYLSHDLLEGRGTGQRGGDIAAEYIATQFALYGLKPAGDAGTYLQKVPMVGITPAPETTFSLVSSKGATTDLKPLEQYVAYDQTQKPQSDVDAEIVYVGYGIEAPEYKWDDYKGTDVRGKVLLMLVNEPPSDDVNFFKGKALTYYGRWTYKYEMASQKGAAAAVIIHETEPAAYPYSVVKTSWAKENFELDRPNKNMDAVQVRSWITLDVAKKLPAGAGQDFDALKKAAIKKDFRPVALNAKANISIKQTLRPFKSRNVIGKLEGSDSKLKDEYIIYTAHWDHLGRHLELQGDQIFNGAVDNASGDAAVIQLAAAFAKLNPAPKRSALFMCTTAEEAGLLGAKFYAEHPLYPLEKTLADINIDSMNVWGKARDIEDTSFGFTTLDDILAEAAKQQGRTSIPNSRPEKGSIYRADNFEFSKVGLPSLYIGKGEHLLTRPPDAPLRSDEFDLHDYHQVTDEVKPDWDLTGAVQDVDLILEVGYQVANGDKFPEWKAGTEFKSKRDAMMGKR
jgi:Zn-dependent M28 family amino/carboxypeptidase